MKNNISILESLFVLFIAFIAGFANVFVFYYIYTDLNSLMAFNLPSFTYGHAYLTIFALGVMSYIFRKVEKNSPDLTFLEGLSMILSKTVALYVSLGIYYIISAIVF